MSGGPYSAPLEPLLALGEPDLAEDWADYRALGLGEEHVPELIRMAGDPELLRAEEDEPAIWGPIHAWRALGQLRAVEAVDPLLEVMEALEDEDADWAHEDLPEVFGRIGPAAIPSLDRYLADPERDEWNRLAAAGGLREIAAKHPEARDAAVAALLRQMERWARSPETVNTFVMFHLVELGAREAAPVIGRAFEAAAVDPAVCGDWEDVQVQLGLLEKRATPRPTRRPGPFAPLPEERPDRSVRRTDAKAKSRRKAARASRKRNRRRKK